MTKNNQIMKESPSQLKSRCVAAQYDSDLTIPVVWDRFVTLAPPYGRSPLRHVLFREGSRFVGVPLVEKVDGVQSVD